MIETKDSGINRIGEIPKHWKFISVQYLSKIYNGNSISDEEKDNYTVETNIPYIATKDVSLDYCVANYENGLFVPENSKFRIAPAGSTLLCIEGGSAGRKKAYLTRNVAFVNKLCAFVPKDVNGKFLFYAICSPIFKLQFDRQLTGIIGGVSPNTIKKFKIPVPPIDEQKAISDFLDKECGKIDEIISGVKNQIEILKEYKKSLITETVTKGLNPTAEMKDSGIKWIGNIPKHWKISRLKYLGVAQNGLTYDPQDLSDVGRLVLRSSNIRNGKLDLTDAIFVSRKIPSNIVLQKNDLLICSRNGSRDLIGKCALITDEVIGETYGAFMCNFRSENNIFLYWVFQAGIFDYYLATFLTSTVNQLTNSNLYSMKIPVPPIDEQKAISDFLDDKCKKIDELIEQKQKQLETLAEYKKSVIYEYVTGKKRVEEC